MEQDLEELLRRSVSETPARDDGTADAIHRARSRCCAWALDSERQPRLTFLERVSEQIGAALRTSFLSRRCRPQPPVLPGTTHGVVIPALERESGKTYGTGFGVSVNPEFLREGTALKDFRKPPLTLVGHNHAADASGTIALYQSIDAPLVSTSIRVAEMVKYTSNTWHALKVCFANEIGNLCKELDVAAADVMAVFSRDEQLNLSRYYLKPGFSIRWLVPAQGRPGAAASRQGARRRSAGHPVDSPEQQLQSVRPSNR